MGGVMKGKAKKAVAIRFSEIKAKQDNIGSGDRVNFKAAIRFRDAHNIPPFLYIRVCNVDLPLAFYYRNPKRRI
jgi:hypothetical protein